MATCTPCRFNSIMTGGLTHGEDWVWAQLQTVWPLAPKYRQQALNTYPGLRDRFVAADAAGQ